MSRRSLAVSAALLLALGGAAARATTFKMVSDEALADQAEVIVEAVVVGVEDAPLTGAPATDHTVEVSRVLKGHVPGGTLVMRTPGGANLRGEGLRVWGAPRFAAGERALLFLRQAGDGTWRPLHLMLGAFHQRASGGRRVAFRDLSDAAELSGSKLAPAREELRDAGRFAEWLEDRANGLPRARDYGLGTADPKAMSALTAPFTYLVPNDGVAIRWFRFDNGAVPFRVHQAGQPGLSLDATIAAFSAGLEAWNGDPGSNVRYVLAGTTGAGGGLAGADGVNTILFDDPFRNDPAEAVEGTFSCVTGGVIAVGGPYFFNSTRGYRGKRYHEAGEADIVTNDGTECLFRDNPVGASEVFAHELGHTLGIGHSGTPDALMRATMHDDGRGARLHADDRAAVRSLYPGGSGGDAAALAKPRRLVARATSPTAVRLSWLDRSDGEESFLVEVKQGRRFVELGSVPADETGAVVTGLRPNRVYVFRVRATAGGAFSAYSNVARVKTPR
jgi:hypothetical protein